MTYTNLPPTLFEMFGSLDDRVRKLETGPNLAYTTGFDALQQAQTAQNGATNGYAQAIIAQAQAAAANVQALTAQSTATQAQIQAANASVQANIAQSQATLASTQATVAQTSADGKNTIIYSASAPGATANKAGDIWFQYATTATITNAVGNGTVVTYTASNNFIAGTTLNISGITPAQYNSTSATVVSATNSSFTVKSTATGSYSSGGSAQPISSSTFSTITNVSGNGTTVTYTASNTFSAGMSVSISGITPSQYNFASANIVSANSSSFTINSSATGGYISGGIAQPFSTNMIIGQWTGNGGTSWTQVALSTAVFSNIDAGKITTGTITSIEYNNGSGTFVVTPAGALTASSATIQGTIKAEAGYFGNYAGGNYWSVGASGLTAVGTGTITGGLIQGSSIAVPQVSPKFQVDNAGNMTASSASIQGTIWAKTGYIGDPAGSNVWAIYAQGIQASGNAYIYAGSITGSTITGGTVQTSTGSTSIKMVGSTNSLDFYTSGSITGQIYPYSSNGIFLQYGTSSTNPNIIIGAGIVSLYANASNIINLQTVGGTTITSSSVTVNSSLTVSSGYKFNSPDIYSTTNSNAANVFVTASGYLQRSTASSMRYKMNITDLTDIADLDPKKLLNLHPRAFEYKPEYLPDADPRSGKRIPGFIAEEVADVYGIAADLVEDKPETWNERMIVPGILALVQDLEKRLTKLEGNNG